MTTESPEIAEDTEVKTDRRRSEKIDDPSAYFAEWVYDIQPHHWGIFGVSKREFVKNKKPYMAWAVNNPETTDVYAGYIFYSKHKTPAYIQVVATWVNQSTGESMVEAHYTSTASSIKRAALVVTTQQLREWIKTGMLPSSHYEVDRANSKGGTFAWTLPK